MPNYLDNKLRGVWKESPHAIVAWVLISSFCYYHKDSPILEDTTYDKLCKHLHDKWDDYQHPHKHLIDKDSLRQGSLYYLKWQDYPNITKSVAGDLLEQVYGDWRGQTHM